MDWYDLFVYLFIASLIAAVVWALSFTRSRSTETATHRGSWITGVLALLIGLHPAAWGLLLLAGALPTLMKPEIPGPLPGTHQIVRFVVFVCTVISGVYFTAAANTFYRPHIAWRLHCVVAMVEGFNVAGLLAALANGIASGSDHVFENVIGRSLDWRCAYYLCLYGLVSVHCLFAFRDTWMAIRSLFTRGHEQIAKEIEQK